MAALREIAVEDEVGAARDDPLSVKDVAEVRKPEFGCAREDCELSKGCRKANGEEAALEFRGSDDELIDGGAVPRVRSSLAFKPDVGGGPGPGP